MIWLIDDHGRTWPAESHPIARWHAADRPIEYAVWERGFVSVRTRGGAMMIAFNPRRTRRVTLATTVYFLSTFCCAGRAALTHGSSERQTTEIFGKIAPTLRRMEEICARSPYERVTILSQVRENACRRWDNSPEAAALIGAWRDAGGLWSDARFANLRANKLLDTASVTRSPGSAAQLINYYWGTDLSLIGDRWAKIAVGKDMTEQPFQELARNLALLYRRTLEEQQPSRYEVSAIFPAADGRLIRYSYDRLLLPWHCGRDRYVMHALLRISQQLEPASDAHALR
jgi:hypothetical protein